MVLQNSWTIIYSIGANFTYAKSPPAGFSAYFSRILILITYRNKFSYIDRKQQQQLKPIWPIDYEYLVIIGMANISNRIKVINNEYIYPNYIGCDFHKTYVRERGYNCFLEHILEENIPFKPSQIQYTHIWRYLYLVVHIFYSKIYTYLCLQN